MKVALAPTLGDDDIIIGSLNEIEDAGFAPPRAIADVSRQFQPKLTAMVARACGKSGPEARNIAVKRYFARWLGANSPHPAATRASAFLGEAWTEYRKFCFVRNPYERVASDFYWRLRSTRLNFTFAEYLAALKNRDHSQRLIHFNGITNWEMIAINDVLQVGIIGRYERLEEEFARITAELGLPRLRLGTVQKSSAVGRDYSALYGAAEKTAVAGLCASEIECFGYEFPY